ncbi:MAG: type I methionyl aminopeptidase [Chitinophagaceae bacterium]|nr:type I methionyl aminopeptidase [Oligoflexus sp.]
MTLETEEDLVGLKIIGRIVANCLQIMGKHIEPGMTTLELDAIGEQYLAEQGAQSAPRLVYKFPGTTCISINNEVAHGVPGPRVIRAGDMVNIDVSAEKDRYFGDTGGSFIVPPENKVKRHLCDSTRRALEAAMLVARAGQPLNGIGRAIEGVASHHKLTIIRNLGSHGVGRALHESPEFIPPYYDPKDKRMLKEGMVITIEPFLSNGATNVDEAKDGWTLFTASKYISAQYEHTMVITKGAPLIMTLADAM